MVELARTLRSGVVEARHHGAAVAVTPDGAIVAVWGDPIERVFYRSAIKPFQAVASQRNGADLAPEQLALACASHSAHAIQVAMIRGMLNDADLSEDDLRCPAALPNLMERRLELASRNDAVPRRILYNCSGKHASFLRACAAMGWPTEPYLDPSHPIQVDALSLVAEATGEATDPVGVDGCGAPAPSGTLIGLATAFARLTVEPDFREVSLAMSRFPSLVSSNLKTAGRIGAWWGGPLKTGAAGIIAAGRHGIGLAAKSKEGSSPVAAVALLAVMRHLGLLSDAALSALEGLASPPTVGGGRRVGTLEPSFGA